MVNKTPQTDVIDKDKLIEELRLENAALRKQLLLRNETNKVAVELVNQLGEILTGLIRAIRSVR